jgi:hypothetical protein
MLDKEQRIKEQMTTKAMGNGLMGITGKLACIACNLGSKIVSETPDMFSETSMPDVWELPGNGEWDFKKIHDNDETAWSRDIGFIFDGLSRGIHLEIKYLSDEKSLTVYHKGYTVFREVSGDLEGYVPQPEWEDQVERLFKIAKQIAEDRTKVEKEAFKKVAEKRAMSYLEQLRLRWGV